MILKGLPDVFKPFSIHVAQSDEKLTFAEFKTKLQSYESTEKFRTASTDEDSVMRARGKSGGDVRLPCYSCGQKGHKAIECPAAGQRSVQRQWCSFCKSSTHKEVGQVDGDPVSRPQKRGLMVDTGATSHIVTDITKFKDFDENFKPQKHILELADGVRTSGVALKRGAAKDIFSVKAATARGATVIFKEGQNELIHKDGGLCRGDRSGSNYNTAYVCRSEYREYMDGRLNEASKEDHMSGVVKQDRDKEREFEGGSERRWYHHPSIIKGYG
ncbi:hypothetical protein D4764_15G0013880 [Takifugu flavidus]|uniref:CCHC-type domain-containing protein n=1 Tax=Takifugu flavidus TaxID=433684 RepID=A0A5C6P2I8_9TELE|nr:hypothetical protein D4764_15G0013880 [Takifugu flavidus]